MRVGIYILALLPAILLAACDSHKIELIPRAALFGEPERVQLRLSPDGTQMSFLAPLDGGPLNIWVAPRGDFAAAKPITIDRAQGIYEHSWVPNGHTILYRRDRTGTQNWRVYAVDVRSGNELDLTPYDNVQARIVATSPKHPDTVLLAVNHRDPRWHDIYAADLAAGSITLLERHDGFFEFAFDDDLNARYALAQTPQGGLTISERTGEGWKAIGAVAPEDALTFQFLSFEDTNKRVYMIDSRGRDTAALTRFTPSTGETEVLGQDERADIASILFQPSSHVAQAFTVNYQRPEWRVIDSSVEADLKALSIAAGENGVFEIVDRTRDDSTWVVYIDPVTSTGSYYLYTPAGRKLAPLFDTRPALAGQPLVPMHSALIKARDGLELVAYYSLPQDADRKGDGNADRPSPLVIDIHSGPWARDDYGLNTWHQWLANRGYAVLSVNFRGSTGFGKNFVNAGDREWGGAMLNDIADAAKWALDNGIAEDGKIALVGGHYGGYAALASLAFTPDDYACGIALGAPSNLTAMVEDMPPYWTSVKDILLSRVGDPRTPAGRQLLEAQSPIHRAGAIAHPLLIVQGANDPQVREADSHAIAETLAENKVPVTYILFPDEPGTLSRPVNKLAFYAIAESFLSECLGGRAEPIGNALAGSSAQIVEGAENIPGLIDAMAEASGQQGE